MSSFKKSRESVKEYFKWRLDRNRIVIDKLDKIKKIKNQNILEVGCGYGPLLKLLSDKGAFAVGTEIDSKSLVLAKKLLKNTKRIKLVKVKNSLLPFGNNSFDSIILFDVIEHVKNPLKMINECKRVLKKGGILYVEFTPYYSIIGHHLYDYSKLPIHILPRSFIKKIVFSQQRNNISTPTEYWNQFISLNKLRISEFQKHVSNMTKIEERFIIKYPDLFEINLPFINYLGFLKDFFVISFDGIYRK